MKKPIIYLSMDYKLCTFIVLLIMIKLKIFRILIINMVSKYNLTIINYFL